MKKLFLLLFVPFGSLMCADTNLAISWHGPERVILKAQLFADGSEVPLTAIEEFEPGEVKDFPVISNNLTKITVSIWKRIGGKVMGADKPLREPTEQLDVMYVNGDFHMERSMHAIDDDVFVTDM